MRLWLRLSALVLGIAAWGCGEKGISPPPRPSRLVIVSGDAQSAEAGSALGEPLVVRVEDDGGTAVARAVVSFQPLSGGSMAAGTVTAGADGLASDRWTLGDTAGAQRAEARLLDAAGVTVFTANLTATARAGTPTVLSGTGGDGQTGTVGAALPQPLSVRTFDARGNPVAGATVTWSALVEGGSIAPASSTTDAAGSAHATWTLGRTAGTLVAIARLGSLQPVDFVATATAGPPATLTITPDTATLEAGATVQLSARVRDAYGNVIPAPGVSWTSTDPAVAKVSATGDVTGLAAGSAAVVATATGAADTAVVTVKPPLRVVTTVTVTPGSASVEVGASVQLNATALDQAGAAMDGQSFAWSSSNAPVATVDAGGRVTGQSTGSATVTAGAGGRSGSAVVTVTAVGTPVPVARVEVSPSSDTVEVGHSARFEGRTYDAAGNLLGGRSIAWSSSDALIATVDSYGYAVGQEIGTATIWATSEGVRGAAQLTVMRSGQSIFNPIIDYVRIAAGSTAPGAVTFRVLDGHGQIVPGATVYFSGQGKARPTAASGVTDAAGDVRVGVTADTAVGLGTVFGTLANGNSAYATVEVVPAQAVRLQLEPDSLAFYGLSSCAQITGTAWDRYGNIAAQLWAMAVSAVNDHVRVNDDWVCAVSVGRSAVVAAYQGVADTIPVRVQEIPARIYPQDIRSYVGSSYALTVEDFDGGRIQPATLRWSSSNPAIIAVDASGTITGVAPGTATITASNDDGSASKTIVAAGPATVTADSAHALSTGGFVGSFTVAPAGFAMEYTAGFYATTPDLASPAGVVVAGFAAADAPYHAGVFFPRTASGATYYWRVQLKVRYGPLITSNTGSFTMP